MRAVVLVLGGDALMTGCGAGADARSPFDAMSPAVDAPPAPLDPTLQQRVDDAVASLQSDPCLTQPAGASCAWADYAIGDQLDMARSTGEAILVVDELAAFVPELVRYRNRIAGNYRIDGDRLAPADVSVHLPRRLGDVLVSFAGPEFIPTLSLASIGRAAWPAYNALDLPGYAGHGGTVFGHLIDLVPEQPLVLLDEATLLDIPPAICERGIDAQALEAATAQKRAIAASLKQVMAEHNVRFVNASFGTTGPELASSWERRCSAAAPTAAQLQQLLTVYAPIYDALFNTEGVLAAHAGARLGSAEDFPFDQVSPRYPNQVRIGYFSALSSGLDASGRGTLPQVEQFPGDGDVDAFLNWGCESTGAAPRCADRHYYLTGAYGLTTTTVPLMSSSFINPLALARLISLRYANHADEPMSNALIEALKRELTPSLCGADGAQPCAHQDPLAHQQLEIFRLHYL